MAMEQNKVIINCAITGSIHVPTQSEYLPITPEEIINQAVGGKGWCRDGASSCSRS